MSEGARRRNTNYTDERVMFILYFMIGLAVLAVSVYLHPHAFHHTKELERFNLDESMFGLLIVLFWPVTLLLNLITMIIKIV